MDIGPDETVWSSSIEWHASEGDDSGPFAFTVMPCDETVDPVEAFELALAEPWFQPALPFPTAGYIVDATSVPKAVFQEMVDQPREKR